MNYTLFDLFLNAYNGNSFAQLQIVQRFQPLLKKYAALLKYEDAYSDLQLYLSIVVLGTPKEWNVSRRNFTPTSFFSFLWAAAALW